MFGIGGWELLMIAVVALIVLGPKGLPAAARAIGRVVSELRRATSDLRQSIELDPDLKEIPQALDELNRPFLAPSPYPKKRMPKDGPPEGMDVPPPSPTTVGEGKKRQQKRDPAPQQEPTTERTTTKRAVESHHEDDPRDEPDGRER